MVDTTPPPSSPSPTHTRSLFAKHNWERASKRCLEAISLILLTRTSKQWLEAISLILQTRASKRWLEAISLILQTRASKQWLEAISLILLTLNVFRIQGMCPGLKGGGKV